MKKTLSLLLCMLLAFSLFAACGRKDNNDGNTDGKPGVNDGERPSDGDKTPADDLADGVGDLADGVAQAADDVWDGLVDIFDGNDAPKTIEGDKEVFARDYGIDEDLIESYSLRVPEGEDNASEFFIAKVKEGKMAEVESALEKRKGAISDKWKDSTDAGMAYAKEPVIMKNGNYIMLAVHSDLEKARTEFEKLTGGK